MPGPAQPIYNRGLAITPSNSVNIVATGNPPVLTDAVYIGGAGTLTVVFQDDSTAAFTTVAGQLLPVAVKRVNSTGTAATLLVALWQV